MCDSHSSARFARQNKEELLDYPLIEFLYNVLMNYYCSQRAEGEIKDCLAARKIQKADREKLRRDRLNEHFVEMGNVLGRITFLCAFFYYAVHGDTYAIFAN